MIFDNSKNKFNFFKKKINDFASKLPQNIHLSKKKKIRKIFYLVPHRISLFILKQNYTKNIKNKIKIPLKVFSSSFILVSKQSIQSFFLIFYSSFQTKYVHRAHKEQI